MTKHREFKQNQQVARKKLTVEKLHLPLVHDHHATCSRISITENKNHPKKLGGEFSGVQAKLNSPMRIPESLRAMGTEGFKISSLNEKHTNKNQQKQKSTKKIPS